jgi:hypothetical protein
VQYAERDGLVPAAEVVPNDMWWPSETSQVQTRTNLAWHVTPGAAGV